jgi:hypothetical protein
MRSLRDPYATLTQPLCDPYGTLTHPLSLLWKIVVKSVVFNIDRLVNMTTKKEKNKRLVELLLAQPKLLEVHFFMLSSHDIFHQLIVGYGQAEDDPSASIMRPGG